jgi:acid phosphatase family membrane protein YuiD
MRFFAEYPVLVPLFAGFLAEVGKLIGVLCTKSKIEFRDLLQSGGFPSGHSVFVCSAATTVYVLKGAQSILFLIAVTIAVVVMYDAMKIRRAAGRHAEELNRMLNEQRFVTRLGHTPFEVFSGMIIGISVSYLLLSFSVPL